MFRRIEESPHKDNMLLNKNLPRNRENRQNLAEKLRYLRKYRDLNRQNLKPLKANAIDNVARALSSAPATDPTLTKMISTPLKDLPKEERKNLFSFMPKKAIVPAPRFKSILNKFEEPNASPNNIRNFLSKDDVLNKLKISRKFNNLNTIDQDTYEMFKQVPRLAAVKRETNPLLSYLKTPKNQMNFY